MGHLTRGQAFIAGAIALVATGIMTVPATAQVMTGTVSGSITDEQGGVIPGATLVMISETRGTKSAPAFTSSIGDYVIPNVTADTYTLEVTMSGFKTVKRGGLAVSPGDRVAVPTITLEVGGTSETVMVTAAGPIIQAQTGERSFTVIPEEVQNLPNFDRSFSALAVLAPGMSNSGGTDPARLGGGGANNAMFDGVGIIDTGSNSIQLTMNMEAVAEVKVLTSSYQAEYGRSSGIQISAVTKSGTNQFRGSIYDVKRNSDWNANSWVNNANSVAKPIDKRDDWGYSIAARSARSVGATSCSSSSVKSGGPARSAGRSPITVCPRRPNARAIFRTRAITTAACTRISRIR
jgi:Carboxypeptidase regulatory-like domain